MPSHFSTIGIPIQSQDELLALAQRVVDNSIGHDTEHGYYLQWSSSCGAEVWLQINQNNDLIGVTPHFSGKSRVRVGLTQRVLHPDSTELDGALYGWADPASDDPASGCYPLVFDTPDFTLHQHILLPAIVTVQVAAFAHDVSVFASAKAFAASQTSEFKFASKSYIPAGTFTPDGEEVKSPEAHAMFTGHILEAEMRTNQLTGQAFYWALVETLCATYDVVIDPELLDALPHVGNVLYGSFWISGRIV
ncbi:MAG: hypothetical protein MI924_16700 [Chloroflexales bacterium]|nr:hypothetical protein [Chloroflexales bacterium]